MYFSGQVRICVRINVYVIEKSPFSAAIRVTSFAQSSAGPWAASGKTLDSLPMIFNFPRKTFFAEPFGSANKRTCVSRGGGRGGGFQGVRQAPGPGLRVFAALQCPK